MGSPPGVGSFLLPPPFLLPLDASFCVRGQLEVTRSLYKILLLLFKLNHRSLMQVSEHREAPAMPPCYNLNCLAGTVSVVTGFLERDFQGFPPGRSVCLEPAPLWVATLSARVSNLASHRHAAVWCIIGSAGFFDLHFCSRTMIHICYFTSPLSPTVPPLLVIPIFLPGRITRHHVTIAQKFQACSTREFPYVHVPASVNRIRICQLPNVTIAPG